MAKISAFDVIGPNMIGPSSSHTAGAAAIALLARKILNGEPVSIGFTLYGSFANTYRGHGTDRALLGGMMGFSTDDPRIPDSYAIADEKGIAYKFVPNTTETETHPNTVDIAARTADGHEVAVRGESLGGGKVRISRINGIAVDFSGEYETIIVSHRDIKGVLASITRTLSEEDVNIAFLKLFRDSKGSSAYSIVECDGELPDGLAEKLLKDPNVTDVAQIDL